MISVIFKSLLIKNFKLFKGTVNIDFGKVTVIQGQDENVLSDLMDAIQFVLGESPNNLNVRYTEDLVFGSERESFVQATFQVFGSEPYAMICTRRVVEYGGNQYLVNYNPVSEKEYLYELKTMGIHELGSFLFPRGTLQEIADQTPAQRTLFLEKISKSIQFKDKYERITCMLKLAESHIDFINKKKKYLLDEKKTILNDKKNEANAAKFRQVHEQKLKELYLVQLYHVEKNIEENTKSIDCAKIQFEKLRSRKLENQLFVEHREDNFEHISKEIIKIKQKIDVIDRRILAKDLELTKSRDKVKFFNIKLNESNEELAYIIENDARQQENIARLQRDNELAKDTLKQFEDKVAADDFTCNTILRNFDESNTFDEYRRLNVIFESLTVDKIILLNQYKESIINMESNVMYSRNHQRMLKNLIGKNELKKIPIMSEKYKAQHCIQSSNSNLIGKRTMKETLETELTMQRSIVEETQKQYDEIKNNIPDQKFELYEVKRRDQRNAAIAYLKTKFNGVFGRLIDFVRPKDERHSLAITNIFEEENMNCIVADTKQTVEMCREVIQQKQMEPESFIALAEIEAKPVNEELRRIHGPENRSVNVAYDLLHITLPEIDPIVLSLTGNVLVCETKADALQLHQKFQGQTDVIALDGSFFKKDGEFSSGCSKNVQVFDEKLIESTKQKLHKEVLKKNKMERDLNNVVCEIATFKKAKQVAEKELERYKTQLTNCDQNSIIQKEELTIIEEGINNSTDEIRQIKNNLTEIENQIKMTENSVYEEFCQNCGIDNVSILKKDVNFIRRERKRLKENVAEISSELHALLSISYSTNLDMAGNELTKLEMEMKRLKKIESLNETQFNKLTAEKQAMESEVDNLIDQIEQVEFIMIETNVRIRDIQNLFLTLESKISNLRSRRELLKIKRHDLLLKCRTNDVGIPLKNGSINDVIQLINVQEFDDEQIGFLNEIEDNIEIDYDLLPPELVDIETAENYREIIEHMTEEVEKSKPVLDKILDSTIDERQTSIEENLNNVKAQMDKTLSHLNNLKLEFESVKNGRMESFKSLLDRLNEKIDNIYKTCRQSDAAQANFIVEFPQEPYTGDIIYEFVPPQDTNLDQEDENLCAAFALLIALFYELRTPFWLLHEFDEASDAMFINLMASTIKYFDRQMIIVTGRPEFLSVADACYHFNTQVTNDMKTVFFARSNLIDDL